MSNKSEKNNMLGSIANMSIAHSDGKSSIYKSRLSQQVPDIDDGRFDKAKAWRTLKRLSLFKNNTGIFHQGFSMYPSNPAFWGSTFLLVLITVYATYKI